MQYKKLTAQIYTPVRAVSSRFVHKSAGLKKKNPASFCQRVPLHSNWIEVRLLIGVLYATDGEKSCVRILVANTTESILFNKGEAHKQG